MSAGEPFLDGLAWAQDGGRKVTQSDFSKETVSKIRSDQRLKLLMEEAKLLMEEARYPLFRLIE
jgi:hypothetical protein